jgi:hypothetical protein
MTDQNKNETIEDLLNNYDDRAIALFQHLFKEDLTEGQSMEIYLFSDKYESIIEMMEKLESFLDDSEKLIEDGDYLVYTDDEADEAQIESIQNYINDCILPELPEMYQQYFDSDRFIEDAKYDGRGHTLSSYDGQENEENVNETDFYIYRIN